MDFKNILYVGAGGFLGAILRYGISLVSAHIFGQKFPYGTLIVNALGGLLIGFIMELSIITDIIPVSMRIFLVTGILGGLTTFSTFSWETMSLFSDGSYIKALVNIALNLLLALGGVALGRLAAGSIA